MPKNGFVAALFGLEAADSETSIGSRRNVRRQLALAIFSVA